MRYTHLLFLPLLLAAAGPAAAANNTVFANSFEATWVSGYHVGYQKEMYPTTEIDFAGMSHLVIGRVAPKTNGGLIKTFDIDDVNGPLWAQDVATKTHAHGIKAILMVGGAGETAWSSAAAPGTRTAFVSALLGAMDQIGADGLDLDWEPLYDADHPNLLALAQALRTARPNIVLTIPIGWFNANFANPVEPFYAQLAAYFDQINIMSYDMAGSWDGWQSWHSSALFGATPTTPSSIDSSVDFLLRSGVPRYKLGIGLPFYGTCWGNVSGPLQGGGYVINSDNVFSYHNIVTSYYSAANSYWDDISKVPYLGSNTPFGALGCKFLSYDNEVSIAAKGAYTHRNGLGGTIIWTIGQGYFPELPVGQRNPLLEAVRSAFNPTP